MAKRFNCIETRKIENALKRARFLTSAEYPTAESKHVNSGHAGKLDYFSVLTYLHNHLQNPKYWKPESGGGCLTPEGVELIHKSIGEALPTGYDKYENLGRSMDGLTNNTVGRDLFSSHPDINPEFDVPGGTGDRLHLVRRFGNRPVPTHAGLLVWLFWMTGERR